ncbi:hypothetical protein MTP99_013777 [Tenebrio molitor]|nr:hypothetical protein MTP99_013777 [Tenebrio molitor]
MLKKTLISYENVNIADFSKVSSFLKTKSLGYVPKKSADLNRAEVETFLKEAPNEEFLLVKAVTIFGVCGGCRRQELCDVKVQHVKDEGAVIVVRIPDTKTHVHECQKKPKLHKNELNTTFFCSTSLLKAPNR